MKHFDVRIDRSTYTTRKSTKAAKIATRNLRTVRAIKYGVSTSIPKGW